MLVRGDHADGPRTPRPSVLPSGHQIRGKPAPPTADSVVDSTGRARGARGRDREGRERRRLQLREPERLAPHFLAPCPWGFSRPSRPRTGDPSVRAAACTALGLRPLPTPWRPSPAILPGHCCPGSTGGNARPVRTGKGVDVGLGPCFICSLNLEAAKFSYEAPPDPEHLGPEGQRRWPRPAEARVCLHMRPRLCLPRSSSLVLEASPCPLQAIKLSSDKSFF